MNLFLEGQINYLAKHSEVEIWTEQNRGADDVVGQKNYNPSIEF